MESGQRAAAFSLIELLVVISIFALFATMAVPSIPSLLGAKGVTRGIGDVASVLELARTTAMSRRTYVYVGFENTTNAAGDAVLYVAAAASPDGSSSTTDGLLAISRVVHLENVRQTNYEGLPQVVRAAATNAMNNGSYVAGMLPGGVVFTNGRQKFSTSMVIISPEGELLPSGDSRVFLERACVGLVGMRGQTPMKDGGVVAMDGGSGAITIMHP